MYVVTSNWCPIHDIYMTLLKGILCIYFSWKAWHSVPERIWIKGCYLSQWLPQGERGPPKESKSRWIEILHGGSQFTLWFLKIKNFQNFSDHSEFFFCFTIHKKLNKSCFLKKKILFLKKKFLVGPTVEDFNSSWFWLLRGSPFTLW